MVNIFEGVVKKLVEYGFYDYLFPFIITSAIFFGLFRKSKILGDSVTVSAAVALSLAFFIFGVPVIIGISLAVPLSTFFVQGTVWILIFVFAFLLASFFYPNMFEFLSKIFVRRTMLWAAIAIGVMLFITSNLLSVFTQPAMTPVEPGAPPKPPMDLIIMAAGLIIFIVLILIGASVMKTGES